jgi:hypothetical protein
VPDCEICGSELKQVGQDWAVQGRECPRCGKFHIDTVSDDLRTGTQWCNEKELVNRSGWVREQNRVDFEPTLTREIVARIVARPRPDLRTRAMFLLRELVSMQRGLHGGIVDRTAITNDLKLLGITYSANGMESGALTDLLVEENLVKLDGNRIIITVRSLLAVEKMAATGADYAQGFVAMWFNPEFDSAWVNGFEPAVRNAGYHPFRIDKKDYVGGITDEIITEVRRSRFVVADYTEQVNGVYFEAGFALGLGLQVIPTCRSDHIQKLHFDVRHLNTLPWNDPDDLRSKLEKRIVAILGRGSVQG